MLKLTSFIISLKMSVGKYIVEMESLSEIDNNISFKILSNSHILIENEYYDYFNNHHHSVYIEKNSILYSHSICSEPWSIDRINQKDLPLDNLYNFTSTDSELVDIYVIDTGIDVNHVEFSHKKPTLLDSFGSDNPYDCDGHGTHVAGIIGGKDTGLSPNANIFSIKIDNNCQGHAYCHNMVEAIQFAKNKMKLSGRKSIINLSFGVCYSVVKALNDFMINGGIVSLSSGNDAEDISNIPEYTSFDPLRGFIVGSTDPDDNLSFYSNYGNPVHIYAPGKYINSADYSNDNSCFYMSGTSMAAPLVAAALGIYWNENIVATNLDVIYNLKLNANKNKIITNKTIHNNLLYLNINFEKSPSNYNDILFIVIFLVAMSALCCTICKKDSNHFNIPIRHRPIIIDRRIPMHNYNGELSISQEGIPNDIENPEIEIKAQAINNVLAEGKSHSLELKNNQLVIEDQKCIDESTPISFTN